MKRVIFFAAGCGLLLISIVFGFTWHLRQLLRPVDPTATTTIDFYVEPGATLSSLTPALVEAGVLQDETAFRLYLKLTKQGQNLQAGLHTLSPAMTPDNLIAALQNPAKQLTITVLPGWRVEEIANYLSEQTLPDFDEKEFLTLAATLEGQLAPDTYKIAPLSTATTIVNILHQQFLDNINQNRDLQKAMASSSMTPEEIYTLASILQREARDSEQMRVIAGIIHNRLEDNYPLQLCATAQYALGQDPETGKWWLPPTLADTEYDSPYNTYQYKGLPPGPICAFSQTALDAALHPAATDYYYYLHDSDGQIHYAKTVEQHNANKQYL